MTSDFPGGARPVGPVGLLLSIPVLALLTAVILAAGVGLFALADWALNGWNHLVDLATSLRDARVSVRAGELEAAGFIVGSAVYGAVIVALCFMARFQGRGAWPALLGWAPFRADKVYWALVVAALVYGIAASALIGYLHPASRDWFSLPKAPVAVITSFVLVVVLAPLAEELFFRGWIFTAVRWRFGFTAALWTTAILFAVAHWERTHLYALAVLPIGFLLGYVRERTGSTRATALYHALYNLSGWLLTFLGKA